MRMWYMLALLAPCLVTAQVGSATEPRPITLEEAVKLAQQNAPLTVQARGAIRATEASVRSARGAFLPSLSANTSGSRQGGETFFQGRLVPYNGPPFSFSRGISSSVELFDGGRRLNQLRAANAQLATAEVNERGQRFRVALDVKQQYFNVLAARESEGAARQQLQQAQEQLKVSGARVSAGVATKSDSLRSEIQVGNARLALLTAANNLRNANASLTRLVATPFTVTAVTDSGAAPSDVSLDSLEIARLIDAAPIVQQALSDLSAAHASARASRWQYWPALNLSFSLSGNNTSSSFDFGAGAAAYQNSARLTLSYPIFNGFTREENVTRTSVAESNAIANVRDARFSVTQSLTQFTGALSLAQQRIQIQISTVAAAEEDLRVQQQRYALSASTLLDVLASQTTLTQARSSLIQARYEARVAKAQIEALIGGDIR